jgi:glucose/arabinose dehydrogenase
MIALFERNERRAAMHPGRLCAAAAAVLLLTSCDTAAQRRSQPPTAENVPALRVDVVAEGLRHPWGLAFLPSGDMLVAERNGGVRLVRSGGSVQAVEGGPRNVLQEGQSGLLDVALDPRFAENGLAYISFVEGTTAANRTAIFRARFDRGALKEGRVIFRARPDKAGAVHPSGRMLFLPDETLLLAVGEGFEYREQAQDLRSHLGKVLRLDREGRPPKDNPFVGRANAAPEIYTYGHRNTLGLARDAQGAIWQHENGPRGGDEVNLLRPGANYGWPLTSHGVNYDGTPVSNRREAPGIEKSVVIWVPSIAPSGFAIYQGEAFPAWRGDFFIGALAGQHLRRVRVRDGRAVEQAILLRNRNERIRDVRVGSDGFIYLLTDEEEGKVLRLRAG